MATPKPQIRSMFATPVCVHFLPVAQDVNLALRPAILEHAEPGAAGQGWNSGPELL